MPLFDEAQERELIEGQEALAKWVRAYFLRLTSEGFTEAQALELAKQWQATVANPHGGAS